MKTAAWALLVIVLGLFVVWSSALPHGDAAWIMAEPTTRFCCGPSDCFALHSVKSTRDGWTFVSPKTGKLTVVPYTFKNRFPSIDEHFWACFTPDGDVRCFFTSPEGV